MYGLNEYLNDPILLLYGIVKGIIFSNYFSTFVPNTFVILVVTFQTDLVLTIKKADI